MSRAPAGPPKAFASQHPWDRNFFLLMVGLAWLGILIGFGGSIAAHLQKHKAPYPLIIHVHGFIFVLWLVLFTVQILLIRARKFSLHKQLGWGLAGLAAVMIFLGPATALAIQRAALGTPHADPAFLIIQVVDILAFASLTTAAILLRRNLVAHKRLILLGTLYITDAGYSRWFGGAIERSLGDGFWATWLSLYVAPAGLVLLIGAYDLLTRRRLYPAYVAGLAWILAFQTGAIALYLFSPGWVVLAQRVIAAWPG